MQIDLSLTNSTKEGEGEQGSQRYIIIFCFLSSYIVIIIIIWDTAGVHILHLSSAFVDLLAIVLDSSLSSCL